MENAKRIELLSGVYLTAIQTNKFKKSMLSLSLLRPICEDEVSMNAVLPSILRRGTAEHHDMVALAAALNDLYGASVNAFVRKKGEVQAIGFYSSFIDDSYALGGEKILEDVVGLVGELLLSPHPCDDEFLPDYFEGEKQNLIDRIAAQLNDKDTYAPIAMHRAMCAGEAFGIDRLGTAEQAKALQNKALYAHYKNILKSSQIEIFYCGSAGIDRVSAAVYAALKQLPRGTIDTIGTVIVASSGAPKNVTESMNVSQGKLAIGYRTGITATDEDYAALVLFNGVLGGSVASKLFMNVREKLSLCYYASSAIERHKGILTVKSGIEFENFEVARDEIFKQLDACKKGEITTEELEGAREALISAYRAAADSCAQLEDFYLGQSISEATYGPLELALDLEKVTLQEVISAAKKVRLDTVYFLKGEQV